MSLTKGESYRLIQFIRIIISCPRLIIIVPALIVFVIGYNTTYDFTVHGVNCLFARWHLQHQLVPPPPTPRLFSAFSLTHSALTTVTFSAGNVLTHEFMAEVQAAHDLVAASNCTVPVVLSPLVQWSLNSISKEAFKPYLLQKINYDSSFLLTSFYLDDLLNLNHLVVGARTLKMYLFHLEDASPQVASLVLAWPHVSDTNTVANDRLIRQFIHYYTTLQPEYGLVLNTALSAVVLAAVGYFIFHLYLSISNLYKIKSSFGLVFGWLIEVLISMSASISIVTFFSTGGSVQSWKQLFEPTTVYSRCMYFLTVATLSSRNLIRIVNDLHVETDQPANLQSFLYKFYVGISNNFNREDQSKIIVINRLLRKRELQFITRKFNLSNIRIPNVSKIMLVNLLTLVVMKYAVLFILRCFFAGNFLDYFVLKISRFFLICSLALVIDHLMQLTYLMGIVLIDLHKNEATDILNENVHNNYNIFSKYLLNFKLMDNTDRGGIRYRLGTALLLVKYPTSLKSWIIVMPVIQLINIVIMLLTWSLSIPYNLFNENLELLSFPSLKIIHNGANFLYYLEFLSILVLIITSSIITFELSDFKIQEKEKEKFDSIQLFDEKVFNCIDLKGHDLDPVRLKTNSASPFLISVGLDHKVLIWSPLKVPLSKPINIASQVVLNSKPFEFWPINHVNLNNDGNFIVLINYKYSIIRCFSRTALKFSWSKQVNKEIEFTKAKILESFFREKTVPAFLKRKMMQNRQKLEQTALPMSRRNSTSSVKGNFPNLISTSSDEDKKALLKYEFVIVTNTGDLITYACDDGSEAIVNIIENHYDESETDINELRLVSVKKIITPRVNDRIVCQVSNGDILVAIAINNKWKIIDLELQADYYNKVIPLIPMSAPLSRQNSISYDFGSVHKPESIKKVDEALKATQIDYSKAFIYPIEFVGMVMRVNKLEAELIDVQTGIVMLNLNVGYFKPLSFRVAHLEPTHCRFCGCASIQSFSIIYEEFDSKMLIIHTFKIKEARSRTNICLRVERDPREIRCAGFNSATEDQFWYSDIDGWEVNDINMILGVRRDPDVSDVESIPEQRKSTSVEFQGSGFNAIRSRTSHKAKEETATSARDWEGFVITLGDGNLTNYKIPNIPKNLIMNKIHCVEKFGFKAIAVNFGGLIKILYLGNNNLIEENLYFNDSKTRKSGPGAVNKPINNELLFINKRRKFKGK